MESADLRELVEFAEGDLIRKTVFESERLWAQLLCVDRNGTYGPVADAGADAILTVVAGEAAVQVERKRARLKQWSSVLVPAGSQLVARNASTEPLVILMVTAPPPAAPRG